jgi:sugar fermentation stimulation protein A
MTARKSGDRAAVVFIVQRPDTDRFTPHQTADADFAATLHRAIEEGVEARAFACQVSLRAISIAREIPVFLY